MPAVPDSDDFSLFADGTGTDVASVLLAETGTYPDDLSECFDIANPYHFDPHYYDPYDPYLPGQYLLSFRNYNTTLTWLTLKPHIYDKVLLGRDWFSGTLLNDDATWSGCRGAGDADGFYDPMSSTTKYGWALENYYSIEAGCLVGPVYRISRANMRFKYSGAAITSVLSAELWLPLWIEREGLAGNSWNYSSDIFDTCPPPSFTQNILIYRGTIGSELGTPDFDEFDLGDSLFSDARNIVKQKAGFDILERQSYKGFMKKTASSAQRSLIQTKLNSDGYIDMMLFMDKDITDTAPAQITMPGPVDNTYFFIINSGQFAYIDGEYIYVTGYCPRLLLNVTTV